VNRRRTVDDGRIEVMDPERDGILKGLDQAAEWARTHAFELDEGYLALIERVEALPRNQSGADKSGRWLGSRAHAQRLASRATRLSGSR
jgi:hypothetical protein